MHMRTGQAWQRHVCMKSKAASSVRNMSSTGLDERSHQLIYRFGGLASKYRCCKCHALHDGHRRQRKPVTYCKSKHL